MSIVDEPLLTAAELEAQFSENALTVLSRRYLRKDGNGEPAESLDEMFQRVAHHVAQAEVANGDPQAAEDLFYRLLTRLRFIPNSPTFTGAGTPLGQLAACFVLPIADDMGKKPGGIFQSLRDAALIQQTGGGNGFSFSRLRPKESLVLSSMGQATGPVGFLRVYDRAFGEIAQGGCLLPDTLIFTEQGLLRLDEIIKHNKPGWHDHKLMVATDNGERLSTQGYNNGIAPVLRVVTDEGLELTGTHEHKVKVMTGDGPVWRRLDELQPGDAVLVKLGQHKGRFMALQQPTSQHGNQVLPEFPPILDKEFAFFLGYLIGDGFIAGNKSDHRIGVSVALDSHLLEEMPALIKRIFGEHINVHRQQKSGDASVTFIVYNRAIKDFLQMNKLNKAKSTQARVPCLIRQSPPEIVGAFLRGLFEADGSVLHGYPMLLSSSESLIREVAVLLIGLGCPVRISKQPLTDNHYGLAPIWRIRIYSLVGLDCWKSRISCDSHSRFNICHSFQPDLGRESSYPLPHPEYWISPVLDAITLPQIDKKGRGNNKNFRATLSALRRTLLRYIRLDRRFTHSSYTRLADQYTEFKEYARPIDGYWFVTVQTVEDAGNALTLDIEVDSNHTYLAGGWVTHNSRRGANMAVLRVDHPDIAEFVTCKTSEDAITNFNISVGMLDDFMAAVEADEEWTLKFPDVADPAYRDFHGTLEDAAAAGIPLKSYPPVRARDLFDKIARQAWRNGEPGMLFLDTAQQDNPVPNLGNYECTNPCGEQFLLPYENCCLGSVNLARHLTTTADGAPGVDWDKLAETVHLATRFLDDVVSTNAYVPAVPQLRAAAQRTRRIGLGIMGLADLLYHLRLRYGSQDAQEIAAQVMEFVRYHTMQASVALAEQRGPFPAIEGSRYDPQDLTWQPPQWPQWLGTEPRPLWERPTLDWDALRESIREHGIRNAAQLTIAPTGTIATVAGAEGYGCEPAFALAYTRYVHEAGEKIALRYLSPAFAQALEKEGLDADTQDAIFQQVLLTGSCQTVTEIPDALREAFVTAGDVPAEGHIHMQAALQAFTDASISKTVNFPASATPADIADAFRLAWRLGCKGLTVYVAGSREHEVLETEATRQQKDAGNAPQPAPPQPWEGPAIRPRPRRLTGRTYRMPTPVGTAFVTVNSNGDQQPFEVFLNVAKAGSETAAMAEAIGRLISLVLRLPSPLEPQQRLEEIAVQLGGIGGGRPLGFGHNRVLSLPDGVARALNDYLEELTETGGEVSPPNPEQPRSQLNLFPVGDLCPVCGHATMVYTEGCQRCYACGHSEC